MKPSTPETIDLTPDYTQLRKRMLTKAFEEQQALLRPAHIHQFHAWLAPFVVALESIDSAAALREIQSHAHTLLQVVAQKARDA